MPDEVIVVDNNCTDDTIAIARRFSFVKIVTEKTQGLIAARNRGFNVARGSVLGRIDADARLEPNWVEEVKRQFKTFRPDGISGPAISDALPFRPHLKTIWWSRFYFMWREGTFGVRMLWGANMAISRTAWQKIQDKVCLDDTAVHEDQDITCLIASYGGHMRWCSHMRIRTGGSDYNNWPKFYEYCVRATKTKRRHAKNLQTPAALGIRFKYWQRAWRYLTLALPTVFFVGVSLGRYQIDWLRDDLHRPWGR
jgi:glycosyltransferase involved in cell wall biosynthesis